MSAVNLLKISIVVEGRRGLAAGHELDVFLEKAGIELVPVTPQQVEAARRAWRRFGRGNHPAGLHFGDCFAHALAEATGDPPLFEGKDLAQTDIESAGKGVEQKFIIDAESSLCPADGSLQTGDLFIVLRQPLSS